MDSQRTESYLEEIAGMTFEELSALTAHQLIECSAQSLAVALDRLDTDDVRTVLRKVPDSFASEVMSEMDPEGASRILGEMREERAINILEDLDPDDAVDMVSELDQKEQTRFLEKLEPETSQLIKVLMPYGPETVGGVMTSEVATVYSHMTVDETIQRIRSFLNDVENVYYIYVIDEDKVLVGVVSMRDLILAKPEQIVRSIMKTDVRGVHRPEDDREEVAREMADYNLLALPVVDGGGKIIGVVTHDDVLDILDQEATEDMQMLMGAGADEDIHDSVWYSVSKRIPWLLINLVTAFIATWIISLYEGKIEQLTLLAVFMTIVPSLGGNTGAQTLAVMIRGLALGDVHPRDNSSILWREVSKAGLNGAIVGLIAGLVAAVLAGNWKIGLVVYLAMVLNMMLAGISGAFIPIVLKKLGFDPAQSSAVFLSAITDIAGFLIFFSLSAAILL